MEQIVLQYDTTLTGSTLAHSITCNVSNVWCELEQETISEFTTSEETLLQSVIGRYRINFTLSLTNFENSNATFVDVQKWAIAPVKRFHIITSSALTSINGFTEFNSSNTYNFNIDSSNTTWATNKQYRNVSISMLSESKFTF